MAGGILPAYYHNKANRMGQVITISASGANAGFVNYFDIPIWASDCSTITSNNSTVISIRYVYELLKSKQTDIYFSQKGKSQPHVYPEDIAEFKLPFPNINIQEKIVEEILPLSDFEKNALGKIGVNNQNIVALLNNFKQKKEKLGGYIILNEETKNPKTLKGDCFTYVDIDAVDNGTGKVNFDKQLETNKAPSRARRVAKDNSVLISTVRPYLKAFAYIDKELENTIYSTGFAIIRSKDKEKLLSKFLYYLFMYNDNLMEQMKSAMPKGQYPSINDENIRNFTIPVPDIEEQKEIVAKVLPFEAEIVRLQKEIDEIPAKKQTILDKYLK